MPAFIKSQIKNKPLMSCMRWHKKKNTHIYLLNRKTGNLDHTFTAESLVYFHIVNQYEENDHVVLDICCYKDPGMLNCLYVESMKVRDSKFLKIFSFYFKNYDLWAVMKGITSNLVEATIKNHGTLKYVAINFYSKILITFRTCQRIRTTHDCFAEGHFGSSCH